MENRPAGKRSCVPEGNTPSKPREKRTRSGSKTGVRKPLFRSTRRNLTFSRYRQYVLEIDISKFVTSFIVCKFFNIVSDTDLPNSQRTFFSTISSEKT